ncbi:uncharacterized protein LOC112519961 [Cynara cardunculus var. scolymus]|uniref:uncharacterized protein LOC112519961 n=1 Tax=Cynara cardunculus var. scolymus TaxID=59895 RepID=UPI000D629B05|nr:uncharacterized protein LOC112519961 [Cynara cardunculus var. scolymus]
MTYNEGYEILEKILANNGHWADPRAQSQKKTGEIHDVDAYTALTAQLTSMTNMLKNLTSGQGVQQAANTPVLTVLSVQCVCCGGEHSYEHCPHNSESINFVHNGSGPYTNNYNASWKQHPNFSWNSSCLNPHAPKQQGTSNFQPQQHVSSSQNHHQNFQTAQPPFQNKPPTQADLSSSLEAMIKGLFAHAQAQNQALIIQQNSQNQSLFNQQSTTIRNLQTQVSQLALNQTNRVLGTLPSNIEVPRALGKEHVKAVTLRSGKELTEAIQKDRKPILSKTDATALVPAKERPVQPLEKQASETTTSVPPRSDYPLLFLEDVLKKSEGTEVSETPKLDAKTPSEPPKCTTKTQGIGEARPTTVTLQLANKSIAYPKGKIEDVLVQVDKFIFPADFIILDFEYPDYLEECSKITEIEEMCLEEGFQENLKLEEECDEEIEEDVEEMEEIGNDNVPVDAAAFELLKNSENINFRENILKAIKMDNKSLFEENEKLTKELAAQVAQPTLTE